MKKRFFSIAAVAVMLVSLFTVLVPAAPAFAAGTYYETLAVGKTKYMSGADKVSEAVNSGSWGVYGNSSAIMITDQSSYGCTIEALKPTNGKVAILRYNYNYITYIGTFPRIGTGYLDYYVTVTGVNATSVSLSPASLSLSVGDGRQLSTSLSPSNATSSCSYSSSNTSVATVSSSGYVTARGGGSARITVTTDNGLTASSNVTVSYPALSLSSVSPADGSTGTNVTNAIRFTYNTDLYEGTKYGSISLKDNTTNKSVAFTKSISGSVLTLIPNNTLDAGHSYTATVPKNALKNAAGVSLSSQAQTTFKTKVIDFTSITPASGSTNIALNTPIKLTYGDTVKKGGNASNITIKSSSGTSIPYTTSVSGNVFTITPTRNYSGETQYTVTVPAGAAANSGGIDEETAHITTFTTKAGVPAPVSVTPGNGAVNRPVTTAPQITYNYTISKGEAFGNITLTNKDTDEAVNGAAYINDKILSFTPAQDLDYSINYELYIPSNAVVNSAGEGNAAYTLKFKTVSMDKELISAPVITNNGIVKITAMSGASIYYTTDGTDPALYGELYTGEFALDDACYIRAVAVKNGRVSKETDFEYKSLYETIKVNFGGSSYDSFKDVVATDDGGFIAIGSSGRDGFGNGDWTNDTEEVSFYNATIVKYDVNGSISWKKHLGGQFSAITVTSDGGYAIVGKVGSYPNSDEGWIVKLDENGNIDWQDEFGGVGLDGFSDVTGSADGGIIAVGYSGYSSFGSSGDWSNESAFCSSGMRDLIIVKYDINGNIKWKKHSDGLGDYYDVAVAQLSNGDILRTHGSQLIRYSQNGNYICTYVYFDEHCNSILALNNGGFMAIGNDVVVKCNSNGTKIWTKYFQGGDDTYFKSITQMSDGSFLVSGYARDLSGDWDGYYGKGGYDAIIIKYDSNGDMVYKNTFGGYDDDYYYNVAELKNKGFVAIGYSGKYSFRNCDWNNISGKGDNDAIAVIYNKTSDDKIEFIPKEPLDEITAKEMYLWGNQKISGKTHYSTAFFPSALEDKAVEWSVSDNTVAEVDSKGNLTPLKNGVVTLTAVHTASGLSKSKEITVSGLKSTVDSITFDVGYGSGDYSPNDTNRRLYVPENTDSVAMTVNFMNGSAASEDFGEIVGGDVKHIELDALPKTISFTKSEGGFDDNIYTITIMSENEREEHIIAGIIPDAPANSVGAEISWGSNDKTGILIAAAYDEDGALLGMNSVNVSDIEGNSADIPLDLTDAHSVSTFIWDGFGTMKSLTVKKNKIL